MRSQAGAGGAHVACATGFGPWASGARAPAAQSAPKPGTTQRATLRQWIDDGAVEVDLLNGLALHLGAWQAPCPGRELPALFLSRALLEWRLDQRIRTHPGVRLREGSEATKLLLSSDGRAVRGVAIRDLESGAREELEADLVVEASGRGSRLPRWLEELGVPAPPRSEIRLPVVYVTRTFRAPASRPDWDARERFLRVMNFLDPPSSLLRPAVAARVLLG